MQILFHVVALLHPIGLAVILRIQGPKVLYYMRILVKVTASLLLVLHVLSACCCSILLFMLCQEPWWPQTCSSDLLFCSDLLLISNRVINLLDIT